MMRFKYLTVDQILISLDRLTRFKNTHEKYLRVFLDILSTCLIEPKYKKNDIENFDFDIITEYVSNIINESLNNILGDIDNNYELNSVIQKQLKNYENSVFHNNYDTEKMLDNSIDYINAIKLIPEDCPINLKWLKELVYNIENNNFNEIKTIRNNKLLKYPIEEVILVEGITEEILLPAFSKFIGYDFYAKGIQIIPAGGKNQVVKKYYELIEQLKIPIFVLLDRDAEENIKQIQPKLRKFDRIHLVSCGEFEDLLPISLILRTVNTHLKNFSIITENDLDKDISMVKNLEIIFKTKGLHEFKKAEFAKLVRENIIDNSDISLEIKAIVEEIINTNKVLDSKICS